MSDKVLNIKTGKMENCTVGVGCQRHAHNLKDLNSDFIKSLSESFESGTADFPPLYHGSNFIIQNGIVEPSLQGEGSYEGQVVAFATSNYEEAVFFGKYVYLVEPASDTAEGWADTYYSEEGFPIIKLLTEDDSKATKEVQVNSNTEGTAASLDASQEAPEASKGALRIVDKKDPHGENERARKLWLYYGEDESYAPAWLEYHTDPIGVVYIDYLKSNEEGKGHARMLLDYVYNKYQSSNIDWGEILHPAASHLYEKYSEKHGRSYSWEDWDDTSW